MTEEAIALPRKREIEAAIAAHNAIDPAILLPADAARLLTVMFRRGSVCQHKVADLVAEGFDRRVLPHLLRALVEAGFVTKEQVAGRRVANTYHLHLPSVRP